MVTRSGLSIQGFLFPLLLSGTLLSSSPVGAQEGHVYMAFITVDHGGPAISGFLHSVNDSAVVIIPGRLSKRGLEAALTRPVLTSIPTNLIRKVKVIRLRSGFHYFLVSLPIAAAYSVALTAIYPVKTSLDGIVHLLSTTTLTLITIDLIYFRKFKPAEPTFTIAMQKYCMEKSGLMVDR